MASNRMRIAAAFASLALGASATGVSLTTVGGDDITGNTLVVTGVSVEESDPTVPAWAKAAEPPAADVDAQEITNVAEAVAGNVALAATNYTDAAVSSATNNLRAKTDMAVYTNPGIWTCPQTSPTVFVFNGNNAWTNGSGDSVLHNHNLECWDFYLDEEYKDSSFVSETTSVLSFYVTDTTYVFTRGVREEDSVPTADRLATTSGVAVAIASAVPAEIVTTNEAGQIYAPLDFMQDISIGAGNKAAFNVYGVSTNHGPLVVEEFFGGDARLIVGGTNITDVLASKATSADIASAISTNNAAFVEAVTNCPVVLADMGSGDFGDFGTYGTLGALLAALAAAVVALRGGKQDKYPFIEAVVSNGVLTLQDAKVQTYVVPAAGASLTINAPSGSSTTARDMELVLDCATNTAAAPTLVWANNIHPRTDDATDMGATAEVRNVYYISEYAQGEFVVGGWQETEGGNA